MYGPIRDTRDTWDTLEGKPGYNHTHPVTCYGQVTDTNQPTTYVFGHICTGRTNKLHAYRAEPGIKPPGARQMC